MKASVFIGMSVDGFIARATAISTSCHRVVVNLTGT